MKKTVCFILTALLALGALVGCTGKTPAPAAPTAAPTQAPATQAPTEAPTEVPATEEPKEIEVYDMASFEVACGWDSTYLLNTQGALYGMGASDVGQLCRIQDRVDSPVFIASGIKRVWPDGRAAFALCEDGTLISWGENVRGRLGSGKLDNSVTPVTVLRDVVDFMKEGFFCYALTKSGDVYRWGYFRTEGDGKTEADIIAACTPHLIMQNVKCIKDCCLLTNDGELYSVGIDENVLLAEGAADYYSMGVILYKDTEDRLFKLSSEGEDTLVCEAVADVVCCRYGLTYILKKDGSLLRYTAGEGYEENDNAEPVHMLDGVVSVMTDGMMDEDWGYMYLFALRGNGELWSAPFYSKSLAGLPEDYQGGELACVAEHVKSLATNGATTFIILEDGTLWGTGMGAEEYVFGFSCVGDGTEKERFGFVKIDIPGKVIAVSDLMNYEIVEDNDDTDHCEIYCRTFALTEDGKLYAWGWNGDGLIINGGDEMILSPAEIHFTR